MASGPTVSVVVSIASEDDVVITELSMQRLTLAELRAVVSQLEALPPADRDTDLAQQWIKVAKDAISDFDAKMGSN